jgi:ligand-binding SRPBCC domain-containing protein
VRYLLQCEQTIPASLQEAFAFFEDPRNLRHLTPPGLQFRITTPGELKMRRGAEIDYTIRVAGVPFAWKTVITDYEPPFGFVDEQARGPYKFWRHTHTFQPGKDGVLVSDRVLYELPLGPLGRAAHTLFVRRRLESIFKFRQRELARHFTKADAHTKSAAIQATPPVITAA